MRPKGGLLLGTALPWLWLVARDAGAAFDALAVALPLLVTVVAGACFGLAWRWRDRRLVLVGSSWAALGAVAVVGPWLPARFETPRRPMRIVGANLHYLNPTLARGLADVRAQGGDVVVLTETLSPSGPNARGEEVGQGLGGSYPFDARAPGGDPLVFSRFPVRLAGVLSVAGAVRFEVDAPDGPVVILAGHPHRPHLRQLVGGFTAHRAAIDAIRAAAAAERQPVLVVGDLNIADRMPAYRRLSSGRLRDAMRAGFTGPTFAGWPFRVFLLRIDYILIPSSWCAAGSRRFGIAGSDHWGTTVLVGPCPDRPRR